MDDDGPPPTGGEPTGDVTTGEPPLEVSPECQQYLSCVAMTTPDESPGAQEEFGEGSGCWSGTPADAEACEAACVAGLEQYHDMYFTEPTCDSCDLVECSPTKGAFLLAISTPLAPDLPLQFIVYVTMPTDHIGTLEVSGVRSLSLEIGSVTAPREPIGLNHTWDDAKVYHYYFDDLSTGLLPIPGDANPITGEAVELDATLTGTVKSRNLLCGVVFGEILKPSQQSLVGSTFAARRVAADDLLPGEVVVDCDGRTVSDL